MYQINRLKSIGSLIHSFSTVMNGNMAMSFNGINPRALDVIESRTKFLSQLGVNLENSVCMWVQHEDGVTVANKESAGKSMRDYKHAVKTDALITNRKNLFLFLTIADCLAVIFYDPVTIATGLAHVGWKGADLNIVGKVVVKMGELYGTNPKDLVIGLGPAAYKDSFVKENPSQISDPMWQPFLEKTNDSLYKVDFVGLCKKQLLDAGVVNRNIFESKIDTVKDANFYSHLRDGKKDKALQGRFACVVGIKA